MYMYMYLVEIHQFMCLNICREVIDLTGQLLPIVAVYAFFDGVAVRNAPVLSWKKCCLLGGSSVHSCIADGVQGGVVRLWTSDSWGCSSVHQLLLPRAAAWNSVDVPH